MKTKCRTLYISIIISIVFFVIFSIFFFLNKYNGNSIFEYIYNISLGLFCSSFVVFLISIAEYRVAKVQLLEKIWNESRTLNHALYDIKPLYIGIDNGLIINYINETIFYGPGKYRRKHDAYDKMYKYFYVTNKEKFKNKSKKEISKYIYSLIDDEIKSVLEKLEKSVDQYIHLNNISFNELNNLLGDVQFFTGKKESLKLYNNIYEPLRNMYNKLKSTIVYYCKCFKDNENGRPDIMLKIILKNQDVLFKVVEFDKDNCSFIDYYASFYDNMEDSLEEFRAKTIYNCKEEKIEHMPILTFCESKNKTTH